jgi:hypothetical protein
LGRIGIGREEKNRRKRRRWEEVNDWEKGMEEYSIVYNNSYV